MSRLGEDVYRTGNSMNRWMPCSGPSEKKRGALIISALEASEIPFRPDSLDISSIDRVFFELFGMGSDALIISAYNRLSRRLALGFDDSQIASAADKIKKWVEVTNNNGSSAAIV